MQAFPEELTAKRSLLAKQTAGLDFSQVPEILGVLDEASAWTKMAAQYLSGGVSAAGLQVTPIIDELEQGLGRHVKKLEKTPPLLLALQSTLGDLRTSFLIEAGHSGRPIASATIDNFKVQWANGKGSIYNANLSQAEVETKLDELIKAAKTFDPKDFNAPLDLSLRVASWYFDARASLGKIPDPILEKFYEIEGAFCTSLKALKASEKTPQIVARDQFLEDTVLWRINMYGDVLPSYPAFVEEFKRELGAS